MIVNVTIQELSDCRTRLSIEVDEEIEFEVVDGEPEDNSLERNFSDCFDITELMRMAHDAGRDNEELIINIKEVSYEES